MALEKKTKIIAIVVATVIAAAVLLGLLFGLLLRPNKGIELQVWPRGADGSAEPLISYRSNDSKTYMPWVNRTNDFLKTYGSHSPNIIVCHYFDQHAENMVCDVDLKEFHPCTSEKNYTYDKATPCIFLRLDKDERCQRFAHRYGAELTKSSVNPMRRAGVMPAYGCES